MSDDDFTPAAAPDALRAGGRVLWDGIAGSFELMPEQLVQLEEVCRAKDRLDEFDRIIHGKGVLDLMRFRTQGEHWDAAGDRHVTIEVKFDSVIAQSNATANLMKQLLAALDPLFASYAAQRTQGERFGDWLLRSGVIASPTTQHRRIPIEVAA